VVLNALGKLSPEFRRDHLVPKRAMARIILELAARARRHLNKPLFFDVFSGCGGMCLGLMQAGWQGVFAAEKHPHAFETLRTNLVEGERFRFSWPTWLPVAPLSVEDLVNDYREDLRQLSGRVTLVSGGPPCQGFSLAGRRTPDDPRNELTSHYLEVVRLVEPRFVLLENVRGFGTPFIAKGKEKVAYSDIVRLALEQLGYTVFADVIRANEWGVPQDRQRFIIVGIKDAPPDQINPFDFLTRVRGPFLEKKGLPMDRPVTAREALSDLQVSEKRLIPAKGFEKDFKQIDYEQPNQPSSYQRQMREGMLNGTAPNSLRLPRHTTQVRDRFQSILDECTPGKQITTADRQRLGLKKHSITPLDPERPSVTVTTMPDDILHYSEPRILTVRENARLQSFPDWFSLEGPYTSGGPQRRTACPRYTQVGNAVPPLLAEALGTMLLLLSAD
jgi:DNA (cytosine-5)-methyltransferase 1